MGDKLTRQQLQAVNSRGGKLLVSAAAGSGKTKVLVERLLSYLMCYENPANIDDFLIITYTKAAAAELRGKIAAKISEQLAISPENRHLQRQLQRLHLAKISTVHSFCADILKEHAYLLDIPADFRVADEDACIELQARAMQKTLETAYIGVETDQDFYAFVNSQGFGRDDRRVPEIILQVYNSAHCHLNPDSWLDWCMDVQKTEHISDAADTIWGRFLIDDLHRYLDLQISAMSACADQAAAADNMEKPAALLLDTVHQLESIRKCSAWDEILRKRNVDFGRLTFSKKCQDIALMDQIKTVRDACKNGLNKKFTKFVDSSEQLILDYANTLPAAKGLISLVKEFDKAYSKLKLERRILDFSDLEQKTLDLLLGKSRSGITKAAIEIGLRFVEVMVDEYQDSNEVQDAIFSVLTHKRQNCFMVGDVKQSIYQFRLADPSIFIEKYNSYSHVNDAEPGKGRKVILSNNFRSSSEVIRAVNEVFSMCMSPEVGGLQYGTDEALHEGIQHIPLNEESVELYGIDVNRDTYGEEASFVAERIYQLLDGTHMVRHADSLRPIVTDDIVILLRSPGSVGMEYKCALEDRGIPCTIGGNSNLLQTEEIETLYALLQIINNPLLDIPLAAVLSSRLFAFSADELAQIRGANKSGSLFSALQKSSLDKCKKFLEMLRVLRKEAQLSSITQLLVKIFATTRIDSIFAAMEDGQLRVENLHDFLQIATVFQNSSVEGLPRFLNHLSMMKERAITKQAESTDKGAVRIMSIHKSKGLEFPVVFLCGLSRDFNQESLRAQVVCDKELGLGLSCVDVHRRIQYPTIVKNAIITKMKVESISEEMRVLYVAMTRARDRLIMTYAAKNIADEIEELTQRAAMSDPILLTSTANCPGTWILMAAISKANSSLQLQIVNAPESRNEQILEKDISIHKISDDLLNEIQNSLTFQYPYAEATIAPSKQTATQMKGRYKDMEAAENTPKTLEHRRLWRKPSFVKQTALATDRGVAMHSVMQYIRLEACKDVAEIQKEISRLVREQYITAEQEQMIDANVIANFFNTDIGRRVCTSNHVMREFKFSILVDSDMENGNNDDKILIQGVVDCFLIEDDGITVIDFKSDNITDDEIETAVLRYRPQIETYAKALERIYQLPIKSAQLYFFALNTFAGVI